MVMRQAASRTARQRLRRSRRRARRCSILRTFRTTAGIRRACRGGVGGTPMSHVRRGPPSARGRGCSQRQSTTGGQCHQSHHSCRWGAEHRNRGSQPLGRCRHRQRMSPRQRQRGGRRRRQPSRTAGPLDQEVCRAQEPASRQQSNPGTATIGLIDDDYFIITAAFALHV